MVNKKTKIIATIGPSTCDKNSLRKLYKYWVNIVRFNFSHFEQKNCQKIIERINDLNFYWETNLSLLLDTKWPEIRTGKLSQELYYKKGEYFKIFVNKKNQKWQKSLFCDYEPLLNLKVGDTIRIDSWLFDVQVKSKETDHIVVKALNDAVIGSYRHINLPNIKVQLPWITNKDKKDILFGIKNWIDFVALSFVRSKENIFELKRFLKRHNAEHIKIISKIENQEWIDNIDEIVYHSDWIMIARGDLGIEMPIQRLPNYQKTIVDKCQQAWKFVIIATHLLETMVENPFPTRAEVSDIHNAVLQKADALMLSTETTIGRYPIKAINIMTKIIQQTETNIFYQHLWFENNWLTNRDIEKKELIKSALYVSENLSAKAIIILTKSWKLARLAAAYKPNNQVYAFTMKKSSVKYMNILFWIEPIYMNFDWSNTENLELWVKYLFKIWKINLQDKVIWITDLYKNWKELPIMEILYVSDILD